MSRQGRGLAAPFRETEQHSDAKPAESRGMGPLRSIQTPVVIFLGPRGVELRVHRAVIGLLVDNKAFGSRRYEW